jgi:hypothetical protein
MKINPVVTQSSGVISVSLQALFVNDQTDAMDKAKIAALGDPQVSLVGTGTFTDPSNTAFTFTFPTTEYYVGVTTSMSSASVKFMLALPQASNPNQCAPVQGSLDCITADPSTAAQVWYAAMVAAITAAVQALRNQQLVPTLSPTTV